MNARVEDKSAGDGRSGDILTWIATILAFTYIVWTGTALYFSTPILINMYVNMGVDLHLSTKILIGFYRLMYPILFGGIAALVITKQFFVRDKWISVSVTLAATVAVSLISARHSQGAVPSAV
jgi:hypothetical protein